jgi:uncharacterized protein DUF3551
MRHIVVTVLAASGLAMLGALPAKAVGTRHPFCLQGQEYPGLSYCTFDSYEQCLATASGRHLMCIANPFFGGQSDDPYAYQNRSGPSPSGFPAPRRNSPY